MATDAPGTAASSDELVLEPPAPVPPITQQQAASTIKIDQETAGRIEAAVANYVSTIAVKEGADAGTVAITWSSTFDPKGASEADASKVIGGIYDAGLSSLKAKLEAP